MQIETKVGTPKTAIVTGANGFIGTYLICELLRRGWSVCALGRSKSGVNWQGRLSEAIRASIKPGIVPDLSRLRCCEADLSRTDLGLSNDELRLGDHEAIFLHLAGDTKFIPSDPSAQRRSNVDATVNVIGFLHPFISRVVHVSTAYVAGDRTGVIREDETDLGQGFNNNYERTKLEAEVQVRLLCEKLRLPATIARPSIIVNDVTNGRSSAFTHLNVMVEVVNRIQEFYGIKDGEAVNRAIRLLISPTARPNLAAVDPIAVSLALIAASPSSAGKTIHLCHPAPQSNAEIFELIAEVFGVKGKVHLDFVQEMAGPFTRTEEMIARSFKVYLPYLNGNKTFDLTSTRAVISDYDTLFEPMTIAYIQKVVAFQRGQRR